jgi:uncharacterized RDD family membrane protein YckC
MVAQAPTAHDVTFHAVPYAGVATRAVALTVDALIVEGGLLVLAAMTSLVAQLVGGVHLGTIAKLIAASAWALITAAYFVAFWSVDGQTPGMRSMHLIVTTADGYKPPGVLRSMIRVVALGLCIIPCFLGFLPVLFDDRRRGLHDMAAGTVVRYADGAGAAT